ncbi:hypothetical protein PCYB_001320, partial [Plasmodium cynomolgi strain B]
YPFLKEFPLYKFYVQLDHVRDDGPEYEECSDLLGSNYQRESNLSKICKKVSNATKTFYEIGEVIGSSPSNCCDYFNFWLNDHITKNIPKSVENRLVDNTFDKIFRKIDGPKCVYINLSRCNRDAFQKLKQLYDYSVSFDSIFDQISRGNLSGRDSYCSYIIESVNLYDNITKESLRVATSKYSGKLNRFKNKYNKIKSSALSCEQELPDLNFIMGLKSSGKKVQQKITKAEGHFKGVPNPVPKKVPLKKVPSMGALPKEVAFDQMTHHGVSPVSTIIDHENFESSVTLPNVAVEFCKVLGLSLLLLTLYKVNKFFM